jgi:proteasome accessory factor A
MFGDFTLENPIRAIREISSDITCRRQVRLKNGREMSALDLQSYFLERALDFESRHGFDALETEALREWESVMSALGGDPSVLVDRIDWVTKLDILDKYCEKNNVGLDSPNALAIDLQYHDINPTRGIYNKLASRSHVRTLIDSDRVAEAKHTAPTTTRAHLRGHFIRQAKAKSRDFTVDWVHLKLNEQIQRTVVCKDPFASTDERVDRLIASL